ncbi:MAG: GntR family transcriptional regulator [Pseudomonadota bacterium]
MISPSFNSRTTAADLGNPATVTDNVIKDLREKISSQALLPGTRIPEEELAQAYGIPRAKAREVLATLEDRALVIRVPNKGAVVAFVDMETTYRLYEVREVLDGLAVRLATINSKPEDWQDLLEMFGEAFENSLKSGDIDQHITTIEAFRERVKQAAGNPVLSDMSERLYDRTRVTIRRVALLPGRAEKGMEQYRAVLAAMIRGDADEAEARVRELNRSAREYIERYKNYVV